MVEHQIYYEGKDSCDRIRYLLWKYCDDEIDDEYVKEDSNVKKWLEGKKIIKEVFVAGKLLNFVVA